MPKMRLTWRWKVTIAMVALLIFLVAWMLSDAGHIWMKKKIVERMRALPAAEQRDSSWAGCYLSLAYWAANIRGDTRQAVSMYQQFCGVATGPEAQEAIDLYQQYASNPKPPDGKGPFDQWGFVTGRFCGLCSTDGATGWGPFHPRAPEAYWRHLEILDVQTISKQPYHQEVFKFYRLFYTWFIAHTPDHKPHPQFGLFWAKIMYRLGHEPVWWPEDIDRSAPKAGPLPKVEL